MADEGRLVEAESDGVLGVVRLARPARRNALTPGMLEELCEAAREVDRASRAVLLCGEGRVFCAGFDLDLCREDDSALGALIEGLARAIRTLRELACPVVVAAHGAAIAGGCALLGGADVVVADAGAKLGYPVVRLGISPAVSAPTLAGMVGWGACRERLLDPGLVSGSEGARRGLVHELVDRREEVAERAEGIARGLAGKLGEGLRTTKAWLRTVVDEMVGVEAEGRGVRASLATVGSEEQRRLLERARGG